MVREYFFSYMVHHVRKIFLSKTHCFFIREPWVFKNELKIRKFIPPRVHFTKIREYISTFYIVLVNPGTSKNQFKYKIYTPQGPK